MCRCYIESDINKIEQSKYQLKNFEIKSFDINYKRNKYSYLERFNEISNDGEKLKIRNIYFLKLSLNEIRKRIKLAYKVYNFTKQKTDGLVY